MMQLNKKGATLVELLIYLGLASIMLVILSELFVSILNESVETQNYSAVQTDGRYILARLRYSINNADSITTPLNLGETSNTLELDGGKYRFYLADNKFYLYSRDDVGSPSYLMSNLDTKITDLVFSQQGNVGGKPVISIAFTASSGEVGTTQHETQTFVGAGGLR